MYLGNFQHDQFYWDCLRCWIWGTLIRNDHDRTKTSVAKKATYKITKMEKIKDHAWGFATTKNGPNNKYDITVVVPPKW